MPQMKRVKEVKPTKAGKRKRLSLRSRAQIKRNIYQVSIITEKGEKLAFRITRRRGIYKIDEKDGVPYTHIRITSLRVNSRIALYSQEGVVNGTVKRIVALDPSTDVEPGVTPPIKRPGGH